MKNIKEITIGDVRSLVDSKVFQRGMEYFMDGCVVNPSFDGNEIFAEVEGSSSSNYRTRVKLERSKLKCECDCPYDWGICKHIIALLLNWINRREDFEDIGGKMNDMADMSHKDLLKIVKMLAKEEPQVFSSMVELALPARTLKEADLPDFVNQAGRALQRGGNYRELPGILRQLGIWRQRIKSRLGSGQYDYVAGQLSGLVRLCADNYGVFDDSNGDLAMFVDLCLDDIKKIWVQVNDKVRIKILIMIWEKIEQDEYGFEDSFDRRFVRMCKKTEELSALRKPIIQRLVTLENTGGRNNNNSDIKYQYERILDLAIRLGYINKKGVYLQD